MDLVGPLQKAPGGF
jgi:hypothetical protein